MYGSLCRRFLPYAIFLVVVFTLPARAADDWLPINPDELKMASDPKAPGAPAIYLYRQVDRDDVENREKHYARIKIFTEEGRKYADLEISFVQDEGDVRNIQGRTIHPDGSIANFDGMVYEKLIVKARGVKYWAKTLTMPDVQPGSVIEYRYTRIFPQGWTYDSSWILSDELFTKYGKFSLRQSDAFALQWSWPRGLPAGTSPPAMNNRVVRVEVHDVPAFQIEDFMPPENEMKFRVDFMYTRDPERNPDKFWQLHDKREFALVDSFTSKRKQMEQAVSQIVSPSDTPEQKLKKIYARCQQIRNTSFEHEKTQQELTREKFKQINNVEEVLKRGYGDGQDITWLFLALARAAGFDASPVLIATRNRHFFFDPKLMDSEALNTNVVLVKLNGKDLYLDPGFVFAPFGLLPWNEAGVPGLRIEKDNGAWLVTNLFPPEASGIERHAQLQLDDSGSLEGDLTLTYKGLTAISFRLDENEQDDADRKKFLEDEAKRLIPAASEVELTNQPEWSASAPTLVAQFHIKIPGWASGAGRRTLLPISPFGGDEKHLFESANRVHPISFSYAFTDTDDITFTLPSDWRASDLPQPRTSDLKAVLYKITAERKDGSVHVSRHLAVNAEIFELKYYPALHNFFQNVRSGDEQQVVLSQVAPQ